MDYDDLEAESELVGMLCRRLDAYTDMYLRARALGVQIIIKELVIDNSLKLKMDSKLLQERSKRRRRLELNIL